MEIDKARGFIKLWRCFMDERIFANKDLWQLWTWLLMKANHEDKGWSVVTKGGGQIEVQVNRGQLVFGRVSAGKELNSKPTTIWKRLQKLKTLGFCDIKSDKNYSVITICNYSEMFESAECRVTSSSERTAKERLKNVTQLKNSKNEKNKHIVDFESLWKDYPPKGKDGKKKALGYFLKTVRSDGDLEDIKKALNNYKTHLSRETWKSPKNGSTWFNNWRNWIDRKDETPERQQGLHGVVL